MNETDVTNRIFACCFSEFVLSLQRGNAATTSEEFYSMLYQNMNEYKPYLNALTYGRFVFHHSKYKCNWRPQIHKLVLSGNCFYHSEASTSISDLLVTPDTVKYYRVAQRSSEKSLHLSVVTIKIPPLDCRHYLHRTIPTDDDNNTVVIICAPHFSLEACPFSSFFCNSSEIQTGDSHHSVPYFQV